MLGCLLNIPVLGVSLLDGWPPIAHALNRGLRLGQRDFCMEGVRVSIAHSCLWRSLCAWHGVINAGTSAIVTQISPGLMCGIRQLDGVGGALLIERRVDGIQSAVSNILPENALRAPHRGCSIYDAEPYHILATLNFVIPAHGMTETLRYTISGSSPDSYYNGGETAH